MSYYNQKADEVQAETDSDTDEDDKMLYQVWYDHPKGSTVEEVRAVDAEEAEAIVQNERMEIVIEDVEQVGE